jgi:ABC-type lipoprotein release transport system permease subunit
MLTLIVILTLTSTLFSVTAYSFLGMYNGFTSYVGEEPDILAIYSKTGSTPFTGMIPIAAVNQVAALKGVEAVSPEVIAPCMINQHSVFVRGVLPQELAKLNTITSIDGENLNVTDTNSAVIGKGLADRLNLKTGDKILVFSVLSQKYVELDVAGIFESGSSLNDEVLVPIYVGQWLRGLSYNDATVIRAKINLNQTSANQLYQEIASTTPTSNTTSPTPTPKSQAQQQLETLMPLSPKTLDIQKIGIAQSQRFMQDYLNRFGISKDTLVVLSILVLVFASGTATGAITLFVKQHSSDIDVLRSIGVTAKKIKADLALRMITWAILVTIIGTALSALAIIALNNLGYLQVLSHSISFQLDPLIIVANFALLALLVGVNVARMELK